METTISHKIHQTNQTVLLDREGERMSGLMLMKMKSENNVSILWLNSIVMNEKKQSLDESHPALMIGSNPGLIKNLNPTILNALQDSSKIKKKIYLPKNTGINYIGLLIGPRGLYQKRLEEESGCKILIRGKGSQKEGSAP